MGKTYGGALIHHKDSAQCQLMDAARRMVRWQRMIVMCVYGGSRWVKGGGGQTHLNCYACPLGLLAVNGRLQSVINSIYSPRYKKSKV